VVVMSEKLSMTDEEEFGYLFGSQLSSAMANRKSRTSHRGLDRPGNYRVIVNDAAGRSVWSLLLEWLAFLSPKCSSWLGGTVTLRGYLPTSKVSMAKLSFGHSLPATVRNAILMHCRHPKLVHLNCRLCTLRPRRVALLTLSS
jgi:hypothetical protein